ncbi:hypothetical protein RJ641_035143 [Dillenia turbinata]|uniref:Uncharacterized protein n=1 Tax=Dillenia turbinata TaxID=194707 RepID=A0AAN8VH55_9MAGN
MSLNCLTCQGLPRTDSDGHLREEIHSDLCCTKGERSWSGNLPPQPYEKIRKGPYYTEEMKKDEKAPRHRRLLTTGDIAFEGTGEPRLIRSSGMRRDWSFEDLRARNMDVRRKGSRR